MPSSVLPRPPNPFIGRADVLRALGDLLVETPLVTITGASGIGKTRTALELGRLRTRDFPGGAFFVDLTDRSDAEGFIAAVASALGASSGTSADAVVEQLSRRGPALVILDNFEQLVDGAADVVAGWLRRDLEARFLVTSRERLRIDGETVFELEPLDLPEASGHDTEAMQLWIACRRRNDATYRPDEVERAVVGEILRQLDGIPLAIELAAARAPMLGPRELLARLARRFEVLSRGARGRDARQSTMQGAIDWSWELLEPWEQTALAQCSVFRGSFVLEAAENVVDLSEHGQAPPVFDVLQTLRDKSLVRALPPAPGTDAPRLALFLSIRDYAAERLAERESTTAGVAAGRMAAYFVPMAERLTAAVDESEGHRALDRLVADRDNLLAIVHRAIERRPPDPRELADAVSALVALDVILWTRGPVGAHLDLLDRVITAAEEAEVEPAVLARALEIRGLTLGSIGRLPRGQSDLARGVAIAEELGDRRVLAGLLMASAWIKLRHRDLEAVEEDLDRAAALAEALGDRRMLGIILGSRGAVPKERADFDAADRLYRQALAIHREVGNERFEGVAHTRLAILNLEHGYLAEARESAEIALGIHRRFQSRYVEGLILLVLAASYHAEGRLDAARAVFDEALPLQRFVGEPRVYGSSLGYRGIVDVEAGDIERGLEHLARSVHVLSGGGERRHEASFLAFLGAIESSLGHTDRGGRRLERAAAILREHPHRKMEAVVDVLHGVSELVGGAAGGVTRARRRLARVSEPGPDGAPMVLRSVDVRIAARLLEREIETRDTEGGTAALVVEQYGRWFRTPEGEIVDCRRRGAMRRILVRLAHQRIHRPGVPLPSQALLASGWPDERMSAESARNRLYVTLNRLRDLGLRDLLLSRGEGYLLDPGSPARFVTGGSED